MTDELPRRKFLATSVGFGSLGVAGCTGITGPFSASDTDDGANQDDHDNHEEHDGHDDHGDDEAFANEHLPYTQPPETVDVNELGGDVSLQVTPARHYLHSGETVAGPMELPLVWAFQAEDGAPSVPGPVLRVEEGTEFSVTVSNHDETAHDHTFHVHAVDRDWKDDGAPKMTGETIEHEDSRTYEYRADVTGTHLYHCHVQTPLHMDMGMYGLLRVDPHGSRQSGDVRGGRAHWDDPSEFGRTGYRGVDREYFLPFREWDPAVSDFHAGMLTDDHGEMDHDDGMDHDDHDDGMDHDDDDGMDHDDHDDGMDHDDDDGMDHAHHDHDDGYDLSDRSEDAFTLNGKSAPTTLDEEEGTLLVVEEGDVVRIHLANAGFTSHTIHSHAHRFRVVEKDGSPIPEGQQHPEDTLNVGAAERYTIEFEADADPGIYPFHCHRLDHVHNDGELVGGMSTAIVYESAMDTDVYEALTSPDGHGDGGHDH